MPLSIPLWVIRLGLEGHVFNAPFRFRLILKSLCVWIVFTWLRHKGHHCWKKTDYNCLFKCTNYRDKNAEIEHNLDNEIQIFTSAREPFSGSEQSVGVSDVWGEPKPQQQEKAAKHSCKHAKHLLNRFERHMVNMLNVCENSSNVSVSNRMSRCKKVIV